MQYCSHYSISVISESSSWSVSSAVEIQWCKLHILYQYKGKCLFLCHENKVYSIIWPLTLKDDLDLEPPLLKILVCMRFTCMLNIKYLSSIVQKLWLIFNYLTFDLKGWPWPVIPQNVCFMRCMCMLNINVVSEIALKWCPMLKLWPVLMYVTLTNDIDLNMSPLKMFSYLWYTRMSNRKYLHQLVQKLWCIKNTQFWTIYLTFEGLPWSSHFAPQNVRLDVIHMYAKYQVAICNRWIVMNNVKVGHKQTNRQGKNNIDWGT